MNKNTITLKEIVTVPDPDLMFAFALCQSFMFVQLFSGAILECKYNTATDGENAM